MIRCYDTAAADFGGGIPDNAESVLFYLDGSFANEAAARRRFPHLFAAGRTIGLTVLGRTPTQGDDFEPGNWQGNAGQWVRTNLGLGIRRPIIYADGSDMGNLVIPSLEAALGRPLAPPGPGRRFRLILANPDGDPTIPPDMDGKQFWWGSIQGHHSVDMDISALRDDFFSPLPPAPPPIPQEAGDDPMIAFGNLKDGRLVIGVQQHTVAEGSIGRIWHTAEDSAGSGRFVDPGTNHTSWAELGVPEDEPAKVEEPAAAGG